MPQNCVIPRRRLARRISLCYNHGMTDETEIVVALGEALWDVIGGWRRIGGAPANFAFHVAQHGLRACALSAVGQDASGDALAAALAEAGAPCRLQRVPYPTGSIEVSLHGAGVPVYDIRPDVAWDHLEATPEFLSYAKRARAVCFGSLAQRSEASRAAIHAFLDAMPAGEDRWRIFDVNLRQGFYTPAIVRDSLRRANVLKLNDEEMEIIGRMEGFNGRPQLAQARALMVRYGLRLLVLTCGEVGSHVLSADGSSSWQPTPRVHVVDTVGAGDSFTATFMAALMKGKGMAEAHRAAVEVSAYVCQQAGAMPALPPHLR